MPISILTFFVFACTHPPRANCSSTTRSYATASSDTSTKSVQTHRIDRSSFFQHRVVGAARPTSDRPLILPLPWSSVFLQECHISAPSCPQPSAGPTSSSALHDNSLSLSSPHIGCFLCLCPLNTSPPIVSAHQTIHSISSIPHTDKMDARPTTRQSCDGSSL